MSMNVRFNVEDYKKKSCKDANSMVTSIALAGLNNIELVQYFVSIAADDFKDKHFVIDYDGYYSIVVKCDDIIIYDGNVVDVESKLQEGTFDVRDWILDNLIEVR